MCLDEPRSKIAAVTRKRLVRRTKVRRSGRNEVNVVRLLRPKGGKG